MGYHLIAPNVHIHIRNKENNRACSPSMLSSTSSPILTFLSCSRLVSEGGLRVLVNSNNHLILGNQLPALLDNLNDDAIALLYRDLIFVTIFF